MDEHVADSLSGLEVPELRGASRVVDIGSGAGFPGLPLAVALPGASVDLVEATTRKCEVIDRLALAAGVGNARSVAARAESLGHADYDVVTARALAPLGVLAEYAAPLLGNEGVLVAWKGAPEADEESVGSLRCHGVRPRCAGAAVSCRAVAAPGGACARSGRRRPGFRAVLGWLASGRLPDPPAVKHTSPSEKSSAA